MPRVVVFLLCMYSILNAQQNEWELISPLPAPGNIVYSFADENSFFAAAEHDGVTSFYLTNDEGKSWTSYSYKDTSFEDITISDGILWGIILEDTARWPKSKVIKSSNYGKDWSLVLVADSTELNQIEFLSSQDGVIHGLINYSYSNEIVSITTRDGGTNWNIFNAPIVKIEGIPRFINYDIKRSILNVWTGSYPDNRMTLFRSDNSGRTWDKASRFSYINNIQIIDSLKILAFSKDSIIRSEDGGYNWKNIIKIPGYKDGGILRSDKNKNLYIASLIPTDSMGTIGLFKSSDFGSSWESISTFRYDFSITSFEVNGNNMSLCASGGLLLKSTDSGYSWNIMGKRFFEGEIKNISIASNDTIIMAGTSPYGGNRARNSFLIKSNNAGKSWDVKRIPTSRLYSHFLSLNSQIQIYSFYNYINYQLYRTSNSGDTWDIVDIDTPIKLIAGFNSNVWVLGYEYTGKSVLPTIYKSEDAGLTYKKLEASIRSSPKFDNLKFINNQYGFVTEQKYPPLKTMDGGLTWHSMQGNLSLDYWMSFIINEIFFLDWRNGWVSGTDMDNKNVILRTFDGGNTWIINEGFANRHLLFTDKNNGWLLSDDFLFNSSDGGKNWLIKPELNNFKIFSFCNNTGYAVMQNNSVYKYISKISSTYEMENNNSIHSYTLYQNYPNPFNPKTNIKFEVPYSGRVSIKLYNMLGEKIADLFDEYMSAGSREITFDATGLSSGVYIYRLESEKINYSRKMILLK